MAQDLSMIEELRLAGWYPGREVEDAKMSAWLEDIEGEGFSVFPRGIDVLREFGGLRIGWSGSGHEAARMVVEFEPALLGGEVDRFFACEGMLKCRLFPLGEVDHGHALLALSDRGELLFLMDEVWKAGTDFRSGLLAMIRGMKAEELGSLDPWWELGASRAGLLKYLRSEAPREGRLGVPPGAFMLWAEEETDALVTAYEVHSHAPGVYAFGSNGAGELLAFDENGRVVMIPFVGTGLDGAAIVAQSWEDFRGRMLRKSDG